MTSQPQRVALVSGASRGIGLGITQELIARGWFVSLGVRSATLPEGLDDNNCEAIAYDSNETQAEKTWVDNVLVRKGRIDAIVANAGILDMSSIVTVDEQQFEDLLNVNVRAPRRLAAAAWPALIRSGQGRIMIIASLSGKRVKSAESALYSVSKFAAVGLAHALRHEGWDDGIRATAICPGLVNTDMGRSITASSVTPEQMSQPEDVGKLVVMAIESPNTLCQPEISFNCQPDGLY